MPKSTKKPTHNNKHHKGSHAKHFLKVYAPYLPVMAVVLFGLFGGILPKSDMSIIAGSNATDNTQTGGVLAYATEMGVTALLNATNSQRTSNGLPALTINSKLNSSAQAKANDMIAKDYWAHNSPSGQEPWVFFDAAGYSYSKAGENLAYGFSTSSDTIIGWMNSPSHRANILDSQYSEVGFGYSNSNNFVGTGEETVIVAHYAKPTSSAAAPAPTTPAPTAAVKQSSKINTPASPEPEVVIETPAEEPKKEEVVPLSSDRINQPFNSETSKDQSTTQATNITILQKLTKGKAPWSATILTLTSLAVVFIWLTKHAHNAKRMLIDGEHFVMHHPAFDVAVVSFVALAVYLSQTTGVIL